MSIRKKKKTQSARKLRDFKEMIAKDEEKVGKRVHTIAKQYERCSEMAEVSQEAGANVAGWGPLRWLVSKAP